MEANLAELFTSTENGGPAATEALFTALYAELHRLAGRQLARNAPGATLGATSVLHEAYLDMAQREGASFPDRARFFTYASRVMRGLIIDYVRQRKAQKRGGAFEISSLAGDEAAPGSADPELGRLSDALDELAGLDPELAQLVDLRYFCGFTFAEIGALRGVSARTVQRDWAKARLVLHDALRAD